MIGLDTNVVVRYLTQHDPKQASIATRLMEKTLSSDDPGFISLVVLAEVVWVLVSLYAVKTLQARARAQRRISVDWAQKPAYS